MKKVINLIGFAILAIAGTACGSAQNNQPGKIDGNWRTSSISVGSNILTTAQSPYSSTVAFKISQNTGVASAQISQTCSASANISLSFPSDNTVNFGLGTINYSPSGCATSAPILTAFNSPATYTVNSSALTLTLQNQGFVFNLTK